MNTKTETRGRKPKPDAERLKPWSLRLTQSDLKRVENASKTQGKDASTWAREILLANA